MGFFGRFVRPASARRIVIRIAYHASRHVPNVFPRRALPPLPSVAVLFNPGDPEAIGTVSGETEILSVASIH
jgi:hypothetical protein